MNKQIYKKKLVDEFMDVLRDPDTRVEVVRRSHYFFFYTYFNDYIKCETAPFQKKIIKITEDDNNELAVIVSFRGSAKSTLVTMSYVLWSILGVQKKRHIVIISQTQDQARLHFRNLKKELEENELLRGDLGPFEQDEWNSNSLVLTNYNARITMASAGQSIRGYRHRSHRPDLIICDDIDDTDSVKTVESRDKTYQWFNSEVIALGDIGTRVIVIGNFVHKDSLVKRLETEIVTGKRKGIYREYPIVTAKGKIMWPGKYPDLTAIENQKMKVGDYAWKTEYMLIPVSHKDPAVLPEDIHYYEHIPEPLRDQRDTYVTGVDIAISEKETADYTAMVSCRIIGGGKNLRIYILPAPLNERLNWNGITDACISIHGSFGGNSKHRFFIEDVMLQAALSQHLNNINIDAKGIKIHNLDKRTRIMLTTRLLKEGRILFPKHGAETLVKQLVDFGSERHDDLADAYSILIKGIVESSNLTSPRVICVPGGWRSIE